MDFFFSRHTFKTAKGPQLTQEIGLRLHEQLVLGHGAVDEEPPEVDPGVAAHALHDLLGLEGDGLEGRAADVAAVRVLREAGDDAASVRSPVRGEETGETGIVD